MSMQTWLKASVIVVLGGMAGTVAVAQEGLPKRKPGLWEMAMQMDGAPAGMPQMKTQQCVDAASDEAMQRRGMAGGDGQSECKQTSIKRIAGGVEVAAECTGKDGKTSVVSKVTGDMNASYIADSTMKFTPPRHGMSQMHMVVKSTYAGACPAGMKPGEVRVGGMSFNPATQGGPAGAGGAGAPAGQGAIDPNAIRNMSPEERAKFIEQMKKLQQGQQPGSK